MHLTIYMNGHVVGAESVCRQYESCKGAHCTSYNIPPGKATLGYQSGFTAAPHQFDVLLPKLSKFM